MFYVKLLLFSASALGDECAASILTHDENPQKCLKGNVSANPAKKYHRTQV
jgi:hypothetical protein